MNVTGEAKKGLGTCIWMNCMPETFLHWLWSTAEHAREPACGLPHFATRTFFIRATAVSRPPYCARFFMPMQCKLDIGVLGRSAQSFPPCFVMLTHRRHQKAMHRFYNTSPTAAEVHSHVLLYLQLTSHSWPTTFWGKKMRGRSGWRWQGLNCGNMPLDSSLTPSNSVQQTCSRVGKEANFGWLPF